MTYSQKLRDPRWQRMRLKIMERDNWQCQSGHCQSPPNTTLHVHHREYLAGRDPWDYPQENLVTYCEKCHELQQHQMVAPTSLAEGEFYRWNALPRLLEFQPRGYLTQNQAGEICCGCFRLDYNPDAPDIVLPGTDEYIARQALLFQKRRNYIPVFVKPGDFGWEYCGRYRVEALTHNESEIELHTQRATQRNLAISMVLFLEKEN